MCELLTLKVGPLPPEGFRWDIDSPFSEIRCTPADNGSAVKIDVRPDEGALHHWKLFEIFHAVNTAAAGVWKWRLSDGRGQRNKQNGGKISIGPRRFGRISRGHLATWKDPFNLCSASISAKLIGCIAWCSVAALHWSKSQREFNQVTIIGSGNAAFRPRARGVV